ncbi:hypothetical protein BYT27DRAFT_7243935 [Phlegmacium glaucopus]|nr:hypothetical protein BYT27DRAFT_7243935 [Phlegmacium glaucopus]
MVLRKVMDRPRRTTRQPVKSYKILVASDSAPRAPKRKVDPEQRLNALLENSKSELASMELPDIINGHAWQMLSGDSQVHLKTLLPPTAFTNYLESLGSDHPSIEGGMNTDEPLDTNSTDAELNFNIFSDPHFLAASRTFQDHLYLGWFSAAHLEKVEDFQKAVRNGTLAAPWKDEVWERENQASRLLSSGEHDVEPKSSFTIPCESSAKAGGAAEVKLPMLVRNGIIRVGDVIAYKRSFANSESIEKDTIIQAIHPTTFELTVLTQPGQEKDLPSHLLSHNPSEPSEPTRSMTISSPTMLETGLLDIDGRMKKAQRPNGNAWKCFNVWRWRAGGDCPQNSRGGRENYGTLFYIRGSYYHEHGSRSRR